MGDRRWRRTSPPPRRGAAPLSQRRSPLPTLGEGTAVGRGVPRRGAAGVRSVSIACGGGVVGGECQLGWLLSLLYPYVGGVRASRLSARMVEHAYRELEECGYSRTTLRTLKLLLAKAFVEQTGRTLGTRKPRESDE